MSEIDLSFRHVDDGASRPGRPAWLAIACALLLHLALAAWIMVDWHGAPAPEPPVIVATLVPDPEPPPPPPPPPAPAKPEPPPSLAARASGPGEHTTAPAPATETAPQPEAAAPEQAAAPPKPETPAPQEADKPASPALDHPKPAPAAPRTEPRKELVLRAPLLAPPLVDRALGEKDETGDPYLNGLWARIERNRGPTTPIGPSGLHLEGISMYELTLDRGGHLRGLYLLRSSGSPLLDDEVKRMIVAATPFPPLPADYPEAVSLKVTIRLFPR